MTRKPMVIWITGASSGLGREVARQYVQAGHTVCVSARTREALDHLADECRAYSGSVLVFALDMTEAAQVDACVEDIRGKTGLPDLVILNAGTHVRTPVRDFDRGVFDRLMQVNVMGTVNCIDAILPHYIQRGSGHLGVVSSVAGYRGLPYASAYGATKAALINMCESLQPELDEHGIKLSLINPGFVRTPLTDRNEFQMPFLMEVDDAARAMIRGLESNRFEITFPRRFTWQLKILRILPIGVYLWLTRKLVRPENPQGHE